MRFYSALIICAIAICVGCSSSSGGSTTTTGTTTGGTPTASNTPSAPSGGAGYAAVQTILNQKCVGCHGAGQPKAGIDLRSYESVMKGGSEGPIVKAGDPAGSVLVQALHGTNGKKPMPMKQPPLAADQIKTIETWIQDGAKSG